MGRVNWMIHCFDTLPSTGLLMNRRSSPGWSRCTRKCSRSLRSAGLIFASRLENNQSAVLVDHCQLREEIAIDSQLLVHLTGEVGVLQHVFAHIHAHGIHQPYPAVPIRLEEISNDSLRG